MRKITTLLSVFITSCQVSENCSSGPVIPHAATERAAAMNAQGRPAVLAIRLDAVAKNCPDDMAGFRSIGHRNERGAPGGGTCHLASRFATCGRDGRRSRQRAGRPRHVLGEAPGARAGAPGARVQAVAALDAGPLHRPKLRHRPGAMQRQTSRPGGRTPSPRLRCGPRRGRSACWWHGRRSAIIPPQSLAGRGTWHVPGRVAKRLRMASICSSADARRRYGGCPYRPARAQWMTLWIAQGRRQLKAFVGEIGFQHVIFPESDS